MSTIKQIPRQTRMQRNMRIHRIAWQQQLCVRKPLLKFICPQLKHINLPQDLSKVLCTERQQIKDVCWYMFTLRWRSYPTMCRFVRFICRRKYLQQEMPIWSIFCCLRCSNMLKILRQAICAKILFYKFPQRMRKWMSSKSSILGRKRLLVILF